MANLWRHGKEHHGDLRHQRLAMRTWIIQWFYSTRKKHLQKRVGIGAKSVVFASAKRSGAHVTPRKNALLLKMGGAAAAKH